MTLTKYYHNKNNHQIIYQNQFEEPNQTQSLNYNIRIQGQINRPIISNYIQQLNRPRKSLVSSRHNTYP